MSSCKGRCDAMVRYTENLIFIELKEVRTDWIKGGIAQLKETILYFKTNQKLGVYSKKRAFLANRKHPHFKFSHKENMQKFKNETGFRLIIHNKIKI